MILIYLKIKDKFYDIETVENTKFKNQYYANENGLNSGLDEIKASILNFKLKKIDFSLIKEEGLQKNILMN